MSLALSSGLAHSVLRGGARTDIDEKLASALDSLDAAAPPCVWGGGEQKQSLLLVLSFGVLCTRTHKTVHVTVHAHILCACTLFHCFSFLHFAHTGERETKKPVEKQKILSFAQRTES